MINTTENKKRMDTPLTHDAGFGPGMLSRGERRTKLRATRHKAKVIAKVTKVMREGENAILMEGSTSSDWLYAPSLL